MDGFDHAVCDFCAVSAPLSVHASGVVLGMISAISDTSASQCVLLCSLLSFG